MASKVARVLRGSLRSTAGPSGMGGFSLPCRKLVLEFNDTWPSAKGAQRFAQRGRLQSVAEKWPSVEVVLLEQPNKHPFLRAFYVNGREKGISLRNLTVDEIDKKIELALDSSGRKLVHLKNRPVVAGSPESARGVWSALHGPRKSS